MSRRTVALGVSLVLVLGGAVGCSSGDNPSRYTTPQACEDAGYQWEADGECDFKDSKKKKKKKSKKTRRSN